MEKKTEYPPENPPPYDSAYTQPYSYPINGNDQPPRYAPPSYAPQVIITTTTTTTPQPPPPPAYSYNPRFPPQTTPPAQGCFERNQKNKPQSNSVGAACLLLTSGGMNWSWGCYSDLPVTFHVTLHMRICWFVAAIIGAIISAIATRRISTKLIYMCSGVLVMIGGIVSAAQSHNAAAIVAARYLNGIGIGMLLVPMLVIAGEETIRGQRGMITSILVAMNFSLGIFLDMIYSKSFSYDNDDHSGFNATELQGVLSIFYSAIALLMSYFLVVESPVYYLMRNQEHEALDCVRRLQRPFVVTFETYELFEELKCYVADNKENAGYGLLALLKLCLYQGLTSLSFSALIVKAFSTASNLYTDFEFWPFMLFGLLRWLGTFIASFTMDCWGRKKPLQFGCIVCGALAIGIGSDYIDNSGMKWGIYEMESILIMLLIMQFFAGFFISSSPVYNTEAYPLAFKPYYIAIGFIVEMIVQIIACSVQLTLSNSGPYFVTMGVIYIIYFFVSLFTMPETKREPLRVAQAKFRILRGM